MATEKRPMLTRPAGCFIQLVAAVIIFYGLSRLIEKPPAILWGIVSLAIGGALLLVGRKTH